MSWMQFLVKWSPVIMPVIEKNPQILEDIIAMWRNSAAQHATTTGHPVDQGPGFKFPPQ